MKENLNHCRHIENERLSFASLYMVLAGGVLTIVGGKGGEINRTIVLALLLTIFILGIIALIVTYKWNYVFEGHRECAIACYKPVSYTHLDVYKRQDYICGVTDEIKPYPRADEKPDGTNAAAIERRED